MKTDIRNSEDVRLLVNTFYDKVKKDPKIGSFFTDIVAVNWENHLPKMVAFWEILLLGKEAMQTNPMQKHVQVNALARMEEAHFDRWVELWFETMDNHFEGPTVEVAKERTLAVKKNMHQRIRQQENV